MHAFLNQPISVILICCSTPAKSIPYKMRWNGRDYRFTEITYHHRNRHGRTITHEFYVTDGQLDFHLRFNTDNLRWYLIEATDGQS